MIDRRGRLGLAIALSALALAACGGSAEPDPVEPPAAAEPPPASSEVVQGTQPAPAATPPVEAQPPVEIQPPGPTGAIVELETADLPDGFDVIPFYVDIPGLLRESPDRKLAVLGLRAGVPEMSGGQGFANRETGELIFMVTIRLDSVEQAAAAVDDIGARPVADVLSFVEPRDTLFESERQPDPRLGEAAVHYYLRYGVETGDRRSRDVTTDLVVFAAQGSVVFLQRSVNVTGDDLETGEVEPPVDVLALGVVVEERIREAVRAREPAAGTAAAGS